MLDNISFSVKRGSLVAVVGSIGKDLYIKLIELSVYVSTYMLNFLLQGSGKSSLLSALLGEMTKLSGIIFKNLCFLH